MAGERLEWARAGRAEWPGTGLGCAKVTASMLPQLVLAALACLGTPEDVSGALARLSSVAAAERLAAERWLAAHLRPEDFALAAEAVRNGGVEERTRLARALGSDERHFELALLFAADSDSELARLGNEAFTALALRWFGGELAPWKDERVVREIAGRSRGVVSLAPGSTTPEALIERLARHAPTFHTDLARDVELGISVDPSLYVEMLAGKVPCRAERGAVRSGPFELVLARALVDLRVSFEGHGFDGAHPFVRIGWQPDLGGKQTHELVLDWCRDVERYPERPRGSGAARALAGCGWPAALEWLERRWVRTRDAHALDGLLVAAGRGRVVPTLATAEAATALLDDVRTQRERDGALDERSRLVLHALARLPRFGARGEDLAELVEQAELGGRDGELARLTVLAGMGRASDALVARLRAGLAFALPDGDEAAALERLVALRLLAQVARGDEAPVALAFGKSLLALALRERADHELLGWSLAARAIPTGDMSGLVPLLTDAELALLVEWLALDERTQDLALGLLQGWLSADRNDRVLGERLRSRSDLGESARLRSLLERAREGLRANAQRRLDTLALHAGLADAQARAAWVASFDRTSLSDRDARWPLVGELAATDEGLPLREVLSGWAKGAALAERSLDAPWVRAYERALQGLLARGEDRASAELRRSLASALRRPPPRHPLAEGLQYGTWPALPGPPPRSLEALDLGP